jgi:hypothetical protein
VTDEVVAPLSDPQGDPLVRLSWQATGVLAIVLLLGVVFVSPMAPVAAGVSLLMFAGGLVAFVAAYAVGVRRSRSEEVSVVGMFLLQGTAPKRIRHSFGWAITAQTTLAVVAAVIRPFTTVAFGILAPTIGLGLMALWGARNGEFPPRTRP